MEAVNVNINGLENIIEASFKNNVEKLVHISTDKAIRPSCVMDATKMLGERLCTARDVAKGSNKTIISCVRFGNVLGSRGFFSYFLLFIMFPIFIFYKLINFYYFWILS